MSLDLPAKNRTALDHVEIVRAQVHELTRMLESNANCLDVMHQIQIVQASLECASRVTLHRHLETCFSNAMLYGRERLVIDELIDAVKSAPAQSHASAIGRRAANNARRHLSATILTLPGISSRTCKAAIERVVSPIAGVGAAEVDVPAKSITIYHDYRAPARRLIEAIEEQGYHVSEASVTAGAEMAGNRDSRWQRGCLGNGGGGRAATASEPGVGQCDLPAAKVGPGFVDGDGI